MTAVPVRKPDLVALVNFKPTVCAAKPEKSKNPNKIPAKTDLRENFFLIIKGVRIIPAIIKRMQIKAIVEISANASLTITKVAPHKMVTNMRKASDLYFNSLACKYINVRIWF